MSPMELVELILSETEPLQRDRGDRLPLIHWHARALEADDARLEEIIRDLDARGIGFFSLWETGTSRESSLALALRVAAIQKRLGLPVIVFANGPMHMFFNGEESTAHVDDEGKPFFDDSFGGTKMGCPFALEQRIAPMRKGMESFVQAYVERDLPIDIAFADWEIDGPIEWNDAWKNSKRCRRCREHIPDIDDFAAFQKALRAIRSRLQKEVLAEPILSAFPKALVGNYGVYPNDGYRYWLDYYEHEDFPEGVALKTDGGARYRPWADEFKDTGFTFAMPVVYTWSRCYRWYDDENTDWRWFTNMLLNATNAGKSTSPNIPIISWIHHAIIWESGKSSEDVVQFSTEKYKELLWHMLLRGCDAFALWCTNQEVDFETRPLHEVYAESLEWREFLDRGQPVSFEVPRGAGPVVSGLRLGDRMLVRRTDFGDPSAPASITVGGKTLPVPSAPGVCRVIGLSSSP
ncbi:MAG: hypothetical protein V2A58_04545 [Planctomycetota bacterium]